MAVKIDWVEVPQGEFVFGLEAEWAENAALQFTSKDTNEIGRSKYRALREAPPERIYLPSYYISRYPITWQQLLEFAQTSYWSPETTGIAASVIQLSYKSKEEMAAKLTEHPADVLWKTSSAFCEWIGGRLPTSQEWEKAARGTDGRIYAWGNEWDETRGNFGPGKGIYATTPVNAYPTGQSPYGVMDMLGNMYEHTATIISYPGYSQIKEVVCRSCSCQYTMAVSHYDPQWFRNRVTSTILNGFPKGGLPYVCFRPVIDSYPKQYL